MQVPHTAGHTHLGIELPRLTPELVCFVALLHECRGTKGQQTSRDHSSTLLSAMASKDHTSKCTICSVPPQSACRSGYPITKPHSC